jgi:hypothetical protein
MKTLFTLLFASLFGVASFGSTFSNVLIPMDEDQTNHLKAYGVVYEAIHQKHSVKWLLNHRGGSFLIEADNKIEQMLKDTKVTFENLTENDVSFLAETMENDPVKNVVVMENIPKVAVYAPSTSEDAYGDAVLSALNYANIPYTRIYDTEVLNQDLSQYNWIHLHHEDFTGQHGKFYRSYRSADWYKKQVAEQEQLATQNGFSKVSSMKLAVAKKFKSYINEGGFLFAMCSATDSYDIALAAEGTDICDHMYDGDPQHEDAQEKLDFSQTLAFKDFTLRKNPYEYEFSSIDATRSHSRAASADDRILMNEFSAQDELVPAMLTQNHTYNFKGFMGQTTDFYESNLKDDVTVLASSNIEGVARYIHGELGEGHWTFYGGHDPEDYLHYIGDPDSDLSQFKNSPGYRVILNNILFPSVNLKKLETTSSNSIGVFPNPTMEDFTLTIDVNEATPVTVELYNIDGKIVFTKGIDNVQKGFQLFFDTEGYAPGVYHLQVKTTEEVMTKKVIIK